MTPADPPGIGRINLATLLSEASGPLSRLRRLRPDVKIFIPPPDGAAYHAATLSRSFYSLADKDRGFLRARRHFAVGFVPM